MTIKSLEDADPEVKKAVRPMETFATDSAGLGATDRLLNYFSDWFKLKKAVARMLQLRKYLQSKIRRESCNCNRSLSVEDLAKAEQAVLRYVQCQSYPDEYLALREISTPEGKRSRHVKKSSSLYKLDPKMSDEGLICVGGRLKNADLQEEMKHPVVLPPKHHVVTLLVRYFHITTGHSAREHVLSLLRQRYLLIRGRSTIRRVQLDCFKCKRQSANAVRQKMGDLPPDRVKPDKPPFSFVGVDCFGPFLIKQGRSQVKRYGCIFTCLTVRAVHIEILHSMDTDSFLNALQRFVARRGIPELIRSDNGTNFVGAERELREGVNRWNQQKIHDQLLQKGID